ncbi:MAG: AAA family ATPase [Parcubacteria group bacterium CG1_02_40_25]|nr:MAG: AAA family ATPase [Parcubacteria group bacterium CG1_02_40_25]
MTQARALAILKTGVNVFLTGEPGSGKTHVINEYVAYLRAHKIEPAITASTGIAATHIGGFTIHSWCGIGIKNKLEKRDLEKIASTGYVKKRVSRAKILIIDEVSMLLPETLLMIDAVCRKIKGSMASFGGLQIVLVGDFFQLPPVARNEVSNILQGTLIKETVARFAYDSSVWLSANLTICYLNEQYRQDDVNFLDILTAIRCNKFGNKHLCQIETRKIAKHLVPDWAPKLFSHNFDVDRVNEEMLGKLDSKQKTFLMFSEGPRPIVEALKKGCLSPEKLCLKVGATVMFTKNNLQDGFVNGTLGAVERFDKISGQPIVRTRQGRNIQVKSMDWIVEEREKTLAQITQLPLRLAWAITVHKSQGMSMDEAVMDLSGVFEFGQGYVALSRVRRLSGLYLLGWNAKTFLVHPEILAKDEIFRARSNEAQENFLKIAEAGLTKRHNDFIVACGGSLEVDKNTVKKINGWQKREKGIDTYSATLAMWNEGKNIAQIAKARELKESTIISHIEKLAKNKQIGRGDLSRLLTPTLANNLSEIHALFCEVGLERLSPVFEELAGKYSYDELRIARMMYQK